jgi:signal-transduction protein with cAMP-binding, CBS, and nucleotidyltransferase domain
MEEQNVDHLLVCAADHTLLGLVSKHYLQRTQLRKVADAMATQPLFVARNAMLNPTVTHMLNEGVSCVAVVEDGKAVGTLTTTDIQLALQAALQILSKTASDERSDDLVSVLGTDCAM